MSDAAIAWPRVLAAAGTLGLHPPAVWALSLREWQALSTDPAGMPMSPARLAELAAAFPDAPSKDDPE